LANCQQLIAKCQAPIASGGGSIAGFEDLEVWRQAHELAVEVYKLARQFPPDERFRYTDQICRASSSIPTNVAEGTGPAPCNDGETGYFTGRYGKRDFKHFLYIVYPVKYTLLRLLHGVNPVQ